MKNWGATDWLIFMIGVGVLLAMIRGTVQMILTRSSAPTAELIRSRELYYGMIGTALGGILVKYGQHSSEKEK